MNDKDSIDKGILILERGLEFFTGNVDIMCSLALGYEKKGKLNEAIHLLELASNKESFINNKSKVFQLACYNEKAKNFTKEEMAEGIKFAHDRDRKVYVTANILAHNNDIKEAEKYFSEIKEIKPDALIISDPGLFMTAKRVCPEIDIHISTQANNTNYKSSCDYTRMISSFFDCNKNQISNGYN